MWKKTISSIEFGMKNIENENSSNLDKFRQRDIIITFYFSFAHTTLNTFQGLKIKN